MIPACAPLLPRPTSHSCSQIKGLQEENEQLRQALAEAGYSLDASGTPTRLSAAAQRTALHENISVDGAGGHGVQLPTTKATRGGGGSVWQCVYVGDTHTNPVQGIASSTDGGVATASWDGTVRLFRDQKQGCAAWGAGVEHSPADCKGEHRDDLCQSKKVGESFDSLNADASRSNCSSKAGGPGTTGSPNLDYSTLILANHLFGTALLSNDGILPSASYGCSLIL